MKKLAALCAVLACAGWLAWLFETRTPLRPVEAPALEFDVPPGATPTSIARELEALGLVRHPLVFRALVALRGSGPRLRAGHYTIEGPLTLEQLLDKLEKGEVARRALTFPEGRNYVEMAAIAASRELDHARFLAAARDPAPIHDLDPAATDLEGYLFPDTYDLPRGRDVEAALVKRMVARFREVALPLLPRAEAAGLSLRQWVTLASIVELETAVAAERPRIAAVFHNRLKKRMTLGTDPTVIYALRLAGRWDGNIRKKDLDIDSPYNTYRRPGLPPGPIGMPGREALVAVLEPAAVDDLYFVSRNDGTHHFSKTLAEHERAVDQYQRRRRAARSGG
ncbi:MAG: endolytic transglycosylase MltG [Vicinamibacteria bacterium]|nr:endolytic transglycosylase MltG [Vicinamibacteria bacterium]